MATSGIPRSIGAQLKIMIVDDHPEMRRLLRRMLSDLSRDITECANGVEALAAFAEYRPDWTIMDVTMQGMDGLEATRRIKRKFPDARVLILTQHDSPKIRQAAMEAGALAFVSKDNLSEIATHLNPPSGAHPSTPTLPNHE
jgi:CheY-like chemotaxis protein